ncbi:hypothetical protein F5050DRAFT_1778135 [Lentinula boryana]|uniref:DUF7770 domain-containing protein n=1 Tax=Lentinula boryana TaxID=40481 RepID=A0ABQ8Q644_9AGAR|nr:hypothetical protein F5050DRAFT_1778135 [Lentinula boryana]
MRDASFRTSGNQFSISGNDSYTAFVLNSFDEQGRGCRHWCAVIFEKLDRSGIQSDVSARSREDEQYRKFGDKIPMPPICGTFYA